MPNSRRGAGITLLAIAAFALALGLCYRAAADPQHADLRTLTVLGVDALLATGIALFYAGQRGKLATAEGWWWSLVFGLWSAAVFRLVPPFINEEVLYFRSLGSPDVPYVLVGAVVHGGITVLLTIPYARRLGVGGSGFIEWTDESWQPGAAAVLAFLIVAAVLRVVVDLH
jgi:asparagine N-glycosylation enzyme membrane subunit Stt3